MSDALYPIIIHANLFISRWYVRPDKRDEFVTAFDALWQADIEGLRAVANTVFYGWGRDGNEFVAVESWKSEDDIAAIRKTEGFKTAVSGLLALCSRNMEMQLYTGMAAPRDWLFDAYPAGPSVVHPRAGDIGVVFL